MNREERERQGLQKHKPKGKKQYFLRIAAAYFPWQDEYFTQHANEYLRTEIGKLSLECYTSKEDALSRVDRFVNQRYWLVDVVRRRTHKKPWVSQCQL